MNRSFAFTVGIVLLSALFQGCAKIKPDEIGIRTLNFGQDKGVVPHDYRPGYHRFFWPLDSWHRFPRTVQRIRFHKESNLDSPRQMPPLTLTSADGDRVVVNAEVLYRITEGKAHFVLQDSGKGDQYYEVVKGLSINEARAAFGKLKTEDFYNPGRRETVRQTAIGQLRQRLEQRGIDLVDFLVLSLEFDQAYENLIKQKKIADQIVALEQSKARAAEERGKAALIQQDTIVKLKAIEKDMEAEMTRMKSETDLQIAVITSEANQYATRKKADADLHRDQSDAKGQLLLKTSEAEGTQRLNDALAGEGGQNLAALEAVKNMRLREVVFPSIGFDWFNPIEMAKKLGAEEPVEKSPELDVSYHDNRQSNP